MQTSNQTLDQWVAKQPVGYTHYPKHEPARCIPDTLTLVDRSEAWHLSDYLVSSVTGGSIWFIPR